MWIGGAGAGSRAVAPPPPSFGLRRSLSHRGRLGASSVLSPHPVYLSAVEAAAIIIIIIMQELIASVDHIKFDLEIAVEQQLGAQPLPFPGMDSTWRGGTRGGGEGRPFESTGQGGSRRGPVGAWEPFP